MVLGDLLYPSFSVFFHHQAFLLVGINIKRPACFCPSCLHWQLHCRTAEQDSPPSLCLSVCLSLSLMCQRSRAGTGQAAMSISSIHQAVGRVAERG